MNNSFNSISFAKCYLPENIIAICLTRFFNTFVFHYQLYANSGK